MTYEEVYEEVIEILTELNDEVDYHTETALVDKRIFKSFDLVMLVGELGEAFEVDITARDFIPENFNSAEALAKMIVRLQEED